MQSVHLPPTYRCTYKPLLYTSTIDLVTCVLCRAKRNRYLIERGPPCRHPIRKATKIFNIFVFLCVNNCFKYEVAVFKHNIQTLSGNIKCICIRTETEKKI